jgi:hypothetical protein
MAKDIWIDSQPCWNWSTFWLYQLRLTTQVYLNDWSAQQEKGILDAVEWWPKIDAIHSATYFSHEMRS